MRSKIAIVGLGGLFPGARNLSEFWSNVAAAKDCSRDVPAGRWLIPSHHALNMSVGAFDQVYSTRGYFLDVVPIEVVGTEFDSQLSAELDPSVHLAIHACRQAWSSAQMQSVDRNRVGVILGHIALPTDNVSQLAREILEPVFAHGRSPHLTNSHSWKRMVAGLPALLAARVLGFGLGGLALDAACASSLYAIKLAVDELQSGRADAMLAGGLSRPDCLYTQMGFCQLRALSLTGKCSPFDARADGLMVGEGAGVFVLKRLADAQRDGDTIHGIVAGIGLSNDREGNLLAPASEGQLRAMQQAYVQADWHPHNVQYIECHATATPLGDAVEFQSLHQLWGSTGWRPQQCAIGAVKSSVGHLLTGAGAAGLMKIVLAMKHGQLPPTANFESSAANVPLAASPFQVLRSKTDWPGSKPRRAAVSAFGFGGINAHLLIEEHWPESPASVSITVESPTDEVAIVGHATWVGGNSLEIPLGRFPIPPNEFMAMMPQQAVMVATAAQALANAGIQKLNDPIRTGIFIGSGLDLATTDFHFRWSRPPEQREGAGPPLTPEAVLGHLASITASRIARTFHVGGPSFTLSSEDTSGLDAIKLAMQSLQRGEIDLAVVGAVDIRSDLRHESSGTLPDVAVAFVVQRVFDAEKQEQQIEAVVRQDADGVTTVAESPIDQLVKMADRIGTTNDTIHIHGCGLDGAGRNLAVESRSISKRPPFAPVGRTFNVPLRRLPFVKAAKIVDNASYPSSFFVEVANLATKTAQAHESYLRFAMQSDRSMADWWEHQNALLQRLADRPEAHGPFMDRQQCLTFAVGKIGDVLGPAYADIDSFPTRVRLPDEPLMLADRIIAVEGEPLSLTHGRVITEHDVTTERWYLDHHRMPTCIAVESGQSDLFLSGFLGIDLRTRGLAVYRLLDAVVTFHRGLPQPVSVIRYDIHIDQFFRQGETHLFRFRFEGTVDGEPLLTMTQGCAGFFTPPELAAGQGIVQTALDRRPDPRTLPDDWLPLAPVECVESYSERQVDALRDGDLQACFGNAFANLPIQQPTRLPRGRMRLVHRVPHVDFRGGRFGLGLIRGEADVHPDDWYLTCHFVDDMVMPGTLMYECCLHTLRIFLMRLGWVGEHEPIAWEPIPRIASRLKCRGQVTATTRLVTYEVSVKELGYRPEPYALADVLMYADGKPIVEITDMSVQMTGMTRNGLMSIWHSASGPTKPAATSTRPLFDHDRILAFAVGKPSDAFGDRYRVFDADRIIARLPGPPFQFLDRIVAIDCAPWVMKSGGTIVAEYDVPTDAWYFQSARRPIMPFAVLLEVALQPCGWLAAYIGSALTSDVDLSFRNLGGRAVQHQVVAPKTGLLRTKVKVTNVSSSGGMIIQHYAFSMTDSANQLVYDGTTYFGFFSKAALANQIGIREAQPYEEILPGERFPFPSAAPFPDSQLTMIDEIASYHPKGGPMGLGFIQGTKQVDPSEWFFQAHFYQDPVMPGSLGLEAFIQLLQAFCERKWNTGARFQCPEVASTHEWVYRGQVLPTDAEVTVQAEINKIDEVRRTLTADGYLMVDGRIIYQMKGFTAQG